MKKNNFVWFPPLWKQAINFLKTGFLVENSEFQKTCNFYWGDITFQEVKLVMIISLKFVDINIII